MRNNTLENTITILLIILFISGIVLFSYTQRYVEYKGLNIARSGMIWTRDINLSRYQKIGNGSGLFGKYDLVTRSMTQGKGESLTIYKD